MGRRSRETTAIEAVRMARRHFAETGDIPAFVPSEAEAATLSRAAVETFADRCLVRGCRGIAPVLSRRTLAALDEARRHIGLTDFAWTVALRREYARRASDLDGTGLLDLLVWLESLGLDVAAFIAARREITSAQIRLLHAARTAIDMDGLVFVRALARFGGVTSTADLDCRGFELMMAAMERDGFARTLPAEPGPDFGNRPGFASAEQLALIRALWREWSGADDEPALSAWLDRFHKVSALRFLTAAAAGKVITALKHMKRRRKTATTEAAS